MKLTLNPHRAAPLYLEPNSGSMQKPIAGLSAMLLSELYKGTINKGAIDFSERNRSVRPTMDFKNFNHLSLNVKKTNFAKSVGEEKTK